MSRDNNRDDAFAAKWGDPGAVTVGYKLEEAPRFDPTQILTWGETKELETKMRFETSPQHDHTWRELKIVSGQIVENRDTGDEDAS